MYQVFNMGVGMVLVVPPARMQEVIRLTKGFLIGEIAPGPGGVHLV
jgi:phosphoribosylformylglycinamidine cyclo-ligase